MQECIRLAEKGKRAVSPNPMVGAVLVKADRIVAHGYHHRFGGPHAEVECLRSYRGDPSTATLYVNLEPCSYYGKTPPCTDLIIRSGIRRVVFGIRDPNPLVSGRGIRALRRAGVDVAEGVLKLEATELNRFFLKHITTGMPYVHVKVAQTLDGKIADVKGKSRWISSPESRKLVHRWRAEHDAILVGAGTIKADDPALTVRMVKGSSPAVVVIDGGFSVSHASRVFANTKGRRVFICVGENVTQRHKAKAAVLRKRGVEIVEFKMRHGVIALSGILRYLCSRQVGSVLVEGGATVFGQVVREGLADEISIFVAPRLMGSGRNAFGEIRNGRTIMSQEMRLNVSRSGGDILLSGTTR